MNLPRSVNNYLSKNGLNGWKLELSGEKFYNNIVVIPAIEEYKNISRLLESFLQNDIRCFNDTLVLFVVNNLRSSNAAVKEDNLKSLQMIRQIIAGKAETDLERNILNTGLNVGLADASSSGLEMPEKDGGVGLARKIGMDLALRQFDFSNNRTKILICLDADCTIGKNYLSSIVRAFEVPGTNAAYVQYEHRLPESEIHRRAIISYEIFLRYYVLELKYADSPFAFPTIGSTMICDYESYIRIGGMNKKKAAEDFYFLEKLAKITEIKKIDSAKVYPSSRGSWRVPFGTGQRVNRFTAGTHEEYVLYDPESFNILKQWLNVFNSDKILSADEYLREAESISPVLHKFLLQNSFQENWDKIAGNSKSERQIEKQKRIWFDGFRTLKLIHFLRDNGYPLINMFDALDKALILTERKIPVRNNNDNPQLEIQEQYLALLRELA
ncbi:MAG: hypothetical protein CVV24_11210 [Ignavibacteriae bacterium HGW-Ignavibacteriae-3]|nr:MAG: hypothetical protein CVV24_11210 [Ignavibacteriae bacterium HGW-Ignavibacteriae-3]